MRSGSLVIPAEVPVSERERHRRLAFQGARNLRDLGGYRAADGRTVRWGCLYRSDSLDQLSRSDRRHFLRLGVTRVIDFRSEAERSRAPDRLPDGVGAVSLPVFDDDNSFGKELKARLLKGDLEGIDPDAVLTEANVQLVTEFTPHFARFLAELTAGPRRPLLFHCTAGKDRTGFAAAVVLRILGVPHEVVLEDYLLSGEYFLERKRWELVLVGLVKGRSGADLVKRLYGVRSAYLEAAFAQINLRFGSFEDYVRVGLGLSASAVEGLKLALLEASPGA